MRGDRALERLLGENRRIRAKFQAVRQLHSAATRPSGISICAGCLADWPCPTIQALEEA